MVDCVHVTMEGADNTSDAGTKVLGQEAKSLQMEANLPWAIGAAPS